MRIALVTVTLISTVGAALLLWRSALPDYDPCPDARGLLLESEEKDERAWADALALARDRTRREETKRLLRKSLWASEEAAVVVQQNPDCFSPGTRAAVEMHYRQREDQLGSILSDFP